ncbi:MAG: TCR/Tet family MFS transporter [Myxococcota bacterium]
MDQKPALVVFAAIGLDAVGIGLVFPILPRLLDEVTHAEHAAPYIGITAALYAVMQFLFAPLLGALSDSVGRRPVLLVSLAGAALNYVLMALAQELWVLLLARALAGLTSANISVATAYLTDITPEDQRARRFGMLNAMFGIGFIVGPILGGVLGDHGLRSPFVAAAALNLGNFVLAALVLPESRAPLKAGGARLALNPLQPLRWLRSQPELVPLTLVFFILSAAGEVYGSCWALWSYDLFRWNGTWIGLSLGAFGVSHALVSATLPGLAVRHLGERGSLLSGMAGAGLALVVLAFVHRGWVVFTLMPLLALQGIGTPALQARATRGVDSALQGQLQGVLASAVSAASIVAPLAFTALYQRFRPWWPGAIWLSVIAMLLAAVPLILHRGPSEGRGGR